LRKQKGGVKMKKLLIFLAIVQIFSFSKAGISIAGQKVTLPGITATGYIPENPSPELSFKVVSLDYSGIPVGGEKAYEESTLLSSANYQDITQLDFGTLVHKIGDIEVDGWFSKKAFVVMLHPNAFGKEYKITTSCDGLAGPGDPIREAFVITPVYSSKDQFVFKTKNPTTNVEETRKVEQGEQPTGSHLGEKGSGASTDKFIYQSEMPGTKRIIQLWLSIPPPDKDGKEPYGGWKKIPLTQTGGQYTGTVTITIETI
jgi:hypothetical protein